jgi:hypothetical protein
MKEKKMANKKLMGILAMVLVFGLVLAGCPTETDNSSNTGNNTENTGDNTGNTGDNTGNTGTGDTGNTGNDTGSTGTGGSGNTGDNTGNTGTGDSGDGTTSQDNTFTPPSKAQLQAFLESYRTDTANQIGSSNAAVYIKSITVNTYTIGGTSITTNPSAVPEDADVKVKFTLRTILVFDNLTMGERLNIDNFRIHLIDALQTWLKQQGFNSVPSANITTGNTVFG